MWSLGCARACAVCVVCVRSHHDGRLQRWTGRETGVQDAKGQLGAVPHTRQDAPVLRAGSQYRRVSHIFVRILDRH